MRLKTWSSGKEQMGDAKKRFLYGGGSHCKQVGEKGLVLNFRDHGELSRDLDLRHSLHNPLYQLKDKWHRNRISTKTPCIWKAELGEEKTHTRGKRGSNSCTSLGYETIISKCKNFLLSLGDVSESSMALLSATRNRLDDLQRFPSTRAIYWILPLLSICLRLVIK